MKLRAASAELVYEKGFMMLKRFSYLAIIALLFAACSGPSSTPLTPSGDGLWLEFSNLDHGYDKIQLVYLGESNCAAANQTITLKQDASSAYADFEGITPACDPARIDKASLFRGSITTVDPVEAYGLFFIQLYVAGESKQETYVVINPGTGNPAPAYLAYVDRDVEIAGKFSDEEYNLDLRAGWNLVYPVYDYDDASLAAFRSLTGVELENMNLEPQTGMFG